MISYSLIVLATDTNQTLSILCSHSDKVDVEYSCVDNFTIISPLTTPSPTETSAIETNDTTTPTEFTNDTTTPTESTSTSMIKPTSSYTLPASSMSLNLILYLFNEDCQQPMATSGFPQNTYMNT